jgi:hypothetical protein
MEVRVGWVAQPEDVKDAEGGEVGFACTATNQGSIPSGNQDVDVELVDVATREQAQKNLTKQQQRQQQECQQGDEDISGYIYVRRRIGVD